MEAEALGVRRLRRGRGAALRLAGRPLHPLERAEHLDLALAAGALQQGPLHAGRAAPLPPARPRRLPGDRRPRPGLGDRDRRAVAARSAPQEPEHRDAAAAVPAPARLPQRRLAAHEHRRVPRLQAGDRRRVRDPPLQRPLRPRAPAPQRRRRRPGPDPHAVGHARPAPARQGAALHFASLPNLHRRVRLPDEAARPDRRHQAADPGRLAAAGRLPGLAHAADPALHASTCGATSRAARTAPSAAGSPACASPAADPSRASRTSTRRSRSTRATGGCRAR